MKTEPVVSENIRGDTCHYPLGLIIKHVASALRCQRMQFPKVGEFPVTETTRGFLFIDRLKDVGRPRKTSIAARGTHHVYHSLAGTRTAVMTRAESSAYCVILYLKLKQRVHMIKDVPAAGYGELSMYLGLSE